MVEPLPDIAESNAASRRDLCVIRNPTAGQRRRRLYTRAIESLRLQGCRIVVRETGGTGDAEALAREVAGGDYDAIVAAGGDGTINEIINGLAGSELPLGLIPLGTANVLAAEIGLPLDPAAIVGAIRSGPVRQVFIGRANGRAFTLMAEVGFNAHVVHGIDLGLKRWIGKGAYGVLAIRHFLRQQPLLYDVELDGRKAQVAAVVIANGRFYGGRLVFAPDARIDRPDFEVCLVERPGRLNTLRYGAGLLLGFLSRLDGYRIETARRVEITGPIGEPVQCDGDAATTLPLVVEVDPAPLSIIVPPT